MNSPLPPPAAAPPQLHLPDLEEAVPVSLGALAPQGPQQRREPWPLRLRKLLASYLPLLLMAALAASTWWLVKHTPEPAPAPGQAVARQLPDYTMQGFSITRFEPDGRFAMRIDGDVLRHYPDTNRFEIDGVRIHAVGADGRRSEATAQRALSNGDASDVQLLGGARVSADIEGGQRLVIEGEYLHAQARLERLRSHLPVRVQRGSDEARAAGLDYDNLRRRLVLSGPVRALTAPRGSTPP